MAKAQAIIFGVGDGLSAAVARNLSADHALTLAARNTDKLSALADETGAATVALDATDEAAVAGAFDQLPEPPRVVVYNPSARLRGPLAELDTAEVRRSVDVTAIGAFIAGFFWFLAAVRHPLPVLDNLPLPDCA